MLQLFRNHSVRGRVTRRTVLTAGAMTACGMTLADLFRREAAAGVTGSRKAVINIHLDGGPPQLDTIDMKPLAPVEIRGEFEPIDTAVPGLQVCELLPRLAAAADQFVFIRSLVGSAGAHDAFQCQSGFRADDLKSLGGRPAMGSVLARLVGSPADTAPVFADLMQGRPLVRNSARAGFLGPAYQPFRPDLSAMFDRPLEAGMVQELARLGRDHATSLELHTDLTIPRLNSRTELLSRLDRLQRTVDDSGMMEAMDRFTHQAVGILTSGQLAEALDLSREDPAIVARYTPQADPNAVRFETSEGPESVRKFLLARRLIEAGIRCVSVSLSDFDSHSHNFPVMRQLLPLVDHGLCTLVEDLTERGMLEDVVIVVWGEFGRTPRIDPQTGGRHHWPQVGPALLVGGGLPGGVVIGETDRTASEVTSRPVHYQDVFATLYHLLGIDATRTTLLDPHGRPQYLLDQGAPLSELL